MTYGDRLQANMGNRLGAIDDATEIVRNHASLLQLIEQSQFI
jgi:hypothetical protein